jgi:hypothetical protein
MNRSLMISKTPRMIALPRRRRSGLALHREPSLRFGSTRGRAALDVRGLRLAGEAQLAYQDFVRLAKPQFGEFSRRGDARV